VETACDAQVSIAFDHYRSHIGVDSVRQECLEYLSSVGSGLNGARLLDLWTLAGERHACACAAAATAIGAHLGCGDVLGAATSTSIDSALRLLDMYTKLSYTQYHDQFAQLILHSPVDVWTSELNTIVFIFVFSRLHSTTLRST
jgi:hypothetical protein